MISEAVSSTQGPKEQKQEPGLAQTIEQETSASQTRGFEEPRTRPWAEAEEAGKGGSGWDNPPFRHENRGLGRPSGGLNSSGSDLRMLMLV